jgi:exopolysaccharide biosynthesis protein
MRVHSRLPRRAIAALLASIVSVALLAAQALPRDTQAAPTGSVERIADGVLLHRLDDPALLNPASPVSVHALQLDPKKIRLETGVAENITPARESVESIARRRGALAAINAGFFALADGKPIALLKSAGALLGRTRRSRGAVALSDRGGRPHLLFDRVTVDGMTNDAKSYRTRLGTKAKDWANARDAVSGAGLLLLNGREFHEWTDEGLAAGFDTTRHPRTLIGEDTSGGIWLITVDGRQPALSLGMSFTELQGLARRLGLRSALNLDGGGSTTMVVRGTIVNHPSDPTGPRQVSDAILVFPRRP